MYRFAIEAPHSLWSVCSDGLYVVLSHLSQTSLLAHTTHVFYFPFPTFADALSDEPTLVELFTGLTSDEVDALAMEDFEKILKLGMEINMPPFSRWGKRRREAIKTMTSLLSDEAPDVMSGKNGANTLPNS